MTETRLPMTEITPEDLRLKAEIVTDPMVVRMLTEAADCIDQLRDTEARLRMELIPYQRSVRERQ